MKLPLISILIPAYNEQEDILPTLRASCLQNYPSREVLLIDDASTDQTAEIAEKLVPEFPHLRVVRLPKNRGVAAARNVGLREAKGEIVVILNADVVLDPDFLSKIAPHYQNGVDYLCVESQVINIEYPYPRFMQALHELWYRGKPEKVEWTEGYSCRRSAALQIGGFPEEFPGASGEDAVFGEKMAEDFQKEYDPAIVVRHVVPHTAWGFWNQWRGRGRGSAYLDFIVTTKGHRSSFLRMLWKSLENFLNMFFYYRKIPALIKNSPRKWRDLFPFAWTWTIILFSWQRGYWAGIFEIRRKPV